MSEIIDKIVEGAGQVMSEVDKGGQIQSAISGLRHRMAEADRRRKLSTVKQEIQDLQGKEAQSINALSAQVLALHEAGSLTQPELVSLCKRVDQIRAQIQAKEAELDALEPVPPPVEKSADQQVASQPPPEAVCPSCGVSVIKDAAFCQSCGAALVESKPAIPIHFCVHCGAQLREGARFCPKCGQTIPSNS